MSRRYRYNSINYNSRFFKTPSLSPLYIHQKSSYHDGRNPFGNPAYERFAFIHIRSCPFIYFCYLPIGWGGGVTERDIIMRRGWSALPGMWWGLRWLSCRASSWWWWWWWCWLKSSAESNDHSFSSVAQEMIFIRMCVRWIYTRLLRYVSRCVESICITRF